MASKSQMGWYGAGCTLHPKRRSEGGKKTPLPVAWLGQWPTGERTWWPAASQRSAPSQTAAGRTQRPRTREGGAALGPCNKHNGGEGGGMDASERSESTPSRGQRCFHAPGQRSHTLPPHNSHWAAGCERAASARGSADRGTQETYAVRRSKESATTTSSTGEASREGVPRAAGLGDRRLPGAEHKTGTGEQGERTRPLPSPSKHSLITPQHSPKHPEHASTTCTHVTRSHTCTQT